MTLKEARERLSAAGIESALFEARLIFRHIGGMRELDLISPLAECKSPAVERAVGLREKRYPLQYIIGEVGFRGELYSVDERVLIPRPDTETLVEAAIELLPRGGSFLDLCTGSGCVAISTLAARPDLTALGADISDGALEVARENALKNGVSERLTLKRLDVLREKAEGNFCAVLSNPPYVTAEAYRGLEKEIFHEPREAFVGGEDGCDFYRAITAAYLDLTERGGFIAYEIGYDQGEAITKIAESHGLNIKIIKDLSGNDRVAVLRKAK